MEYKIYIFLFAVVAAVKDECTRNMEMHGCMINDSLAKCTTSDLNNSTASLPSCTTRISLSLTYDINIVPSVEQKIYLDSVTFHHLPKLEQLMISTEKTYYSQLLLCATPAAPFLAIPNLKVLQIRAIFSLRGMERVNLTENHDLDSLEVLDLTRAWHMGVDAAARFCQVLPIVKTLKLRNIQSLTRRKSYNPSVKISNFMCFGNVHHLDLSYNDIAFISLADTCWDSRLKTLNLDHNIIAQLYDSDHSNMFNVAALIPHLEKVSINHLSGNTAYQDGLWEDDDINEDLKELVEHDSDGDSDPFSIPYTSMRDIPVEALSGYNYWIYGIMKQCGLTVGNILPCVFSTDLCDFLQCLAPGFHTDDCHDEDVVTYGNFARQFCDFPPECVYNIFIPLPENLRQIAMHDIGRYTNIYLTPPSPNKTALCFDPNNHLEILDMSNAQFHSVSDYLGEYVFRGLKKLKFFSIQGSYLPFVINPSSFSDMISLEQMHIGGNKLSENHILPAKLLQDNTKLSILNLSYADLSGLESDAFVNNKHLTILDLSHNRLTATSLQSLNVSQNNIRYLNLSFNQLTSLPSELRQYFDSWLNLELDLSGNNFLCNCEHLEFLQWIQTTEVSFPSTDDHLCTDSLGFTIHSIEVESLYCNWYWMQPVLGLSISVLCFCFFMLLFLIYRKRWAIRNVIFRIQEWFTRPYPDNSNVSYKYDAFVLYSSIPDDRLWVHFKMVQELEKVYGFRLCIHHRDFLGGFDIIDNIEAAIRSSRKVLVVMSENFLKSDWCIEEVQMTRSVDRNKFIVIMYRDVMLSTVHIPTVVRRLLETRTYIEWGEAPKAQELFWKKLRRALYTKNQSLRPQASVI